MLLAYTSEHECGRKKFRTWEFVPDFPGQAMRHSLPPGARPQSHLWDEILSSRASRHSINAGVCVQPKPMQTGQICGEFSFYSLPIKVK